MLPIVMCGIPRSGSTLVWQIFREVLQQDFIRTHPAAKDWEPSGDDVLVMTVRDPRDVANSLYRIRLSRGGKGVGGMDGLENVLNRTRTYFVAAKKRLSMSNPVVFLRYEYFVEDYSSIYKVLQVVSGVVVSEEEQKRINDKYSPKANIARAKRLPSFNEMDEEGIHGDHIGDVLSGGWRLLPEKMCQRVKEFCAPLCEEWDYA